jgi:hypothetical protein
MADAIEISGEATAIKLFGKWSYDDVEIKDISLTVSLTAIPIFFVFVLTVYLL